MAITPLNAQKTAVTGLAPTESNGVAGGAANGYSVSNDGHVQVALRDSAANAPNMVVQKNGTFKGESIGSDETIASTAVTKWCGPYDPEIYGTTLTVHFTGGNETEARIAFVKPLNA